MREKIVLLFMSVVKIPNKWCFCRAYAKQRIHCSSIDKYVCEDAIGVSCVVNTHCIRQLSTWLEKMNIDEQPRRRNITFFTPFRMIIQPTFVSLGSHLNSCLTYIEQLYRYCSRPWSVTWAQTVCVNAAWVTQRCSTVWNGLGIIIAIRDMPCRYLVTLNWLLFILGGYFSINWQ